LRQADPGRADERKVGLERQIIAETLGLLKRDDVAAARHSRVPGAPNPRSATMTASAAPCSAVAQTS
jgi:hypothetical protein